MSKLYQLITLNISYQDEDKLRFSGDGVNDDGVSVSSDDSESVSGGGESDGESVSVDCVDGDIQCQWW